jgi:hypothetical protein
MFCQAPKFKLGHYKYPPLPNPLPQGERIYQNNCNNKNFSQYEDYGYKFLISSLILTLSPKGREDFISEFDAPKKESGLLFRPRNMMEKKSH